METREILNVCVTHKECGGRESEMHFSSSAKADAKGEDLILSFYQDKNSVVIALNMESFFQLKKVLDRVGQHAWPQAYKTEG